MIALTIILFCVIGLVGCEAESKKDFAEPYAEYGGNMLVLGLENDTEPTENGVVYLNAINDNLNVQFANLTDNNSEYILKLFLDYKEVQFSFDGQKVSEYIFTANAGESIVFPINLSSDIPFETSHILTIAILTAPSKHAYEIDLMSNSYGVVLSYELSNRAFMRSFPSGKTAEDPLEYLSLSYQGIILNEDFDAENDTMVKFPAQSMKASPNEPVKLAYRVGNYETADDVAVVLLVDWKQQEINNKPYLYILNKAGYMSYGTLEFLAPSEPGEYEVTAFVVDDPFGLRTADNFHFHDTSYRFTLIVK